MTQNKLKENVRIIEVESCASCPNRFDRIFGGIFYGYQCNMNEGPDCVDVEVDNRTIHEKCPLPLKEVKNETIGN